MSNSKAKTSGEIIHYDDIFDVDSQFYRRQSLDNTFQDYYIDETKNFGEDGEKNEKNIETKVNTKAQDEGTIFSYKSYASNRHNSQKVVSYALQREKMSEECLSHYLKLVGFQKNFSLENAKLKDYLPPQQSKSQKIDLIKVFVNDDYSQSKIEFSMSLPNFESRNYNNPNPPIKLFSYRELFFKTFTEKESDDDSSASEPELEDKSCQNEESKEINQSLVIDYGNTTKSNNVTQRTRKTSCKVKSGNEVVKCNKELSMSFPEEISRSTAPEKVKELYKGITSIPKSQLNEETFSAESLAFQNIMSNTQEILDFQDYTRLCYSKIMKLPRLEAFANTHFVNYSLDKSRFKKLVIFDLDETLIHCTMKDYTHADIILSVTLPCGSKTNIGVNIRPGVKECLNLIKSFKYDIICFTASIKNYADTILDYIDPNREFFSLRLYRTDCYKINYNNECYYIKDLRIFKFIDIKDIVIIDNSILSFSFHLENGIPILPFYDNRSDTDLYRLVEYLRILVDSTDIKQENKKCIKYTSDMFDSFDLNSSKRSSYEFYSNNNEAESGDIDLTEDNK